MKKRIQLNINIDEELLRQLKITALDEGLKLSDFIKNILREKISSESKETKFNKSSFIDKDAINCTNFMKSLFQKKFLKSEFNSEFDAFDDLITYVERSDQWLIKYTERFLEIIN